MSAREEPLFQEDDALEQNRNGNFLYSEAKDESELELPQEKAATSDWKAYVWPVLRSSVLPVLSLLSSISTMYAAQDVVLEALTGMGYAPDDCDSVGEDEEALSQLFINIATKGALWGIPMLTIIANCVMRFFGAIKVKDFLQQVVKENSVGTYLWTVVYAALAIPTDISDTLINVLMSKRLEDEWPRLAIKSEGGLSFVFLFPLNLYYVHLLHQRLQGAWDKSFKGEDRALLSKRLEAIFYELRNVPPNAQAEKLGALCKNTRSINEGSSPTTYSELMELKPRQLEQLAEEVSKNANLPDGSSWRSVTATAMTILLSLLAGAATMRSPYMFYTETCEFPSAVAWGLSAISGLTKSALYLGSYDNLMWCAKNYSPLFGSAPILYGVGAALMALSAAGFWEVGARALEVIFKKVAENPTWWFQALNAGVYLAGVVANTNGAAALALEKAEERRQCKLGADEKPDLAMGFKERASQTLNPQSKRIPKDEEMCNMSERTDYPGETTPLRAESLRSEHSSETSWCTFFSNYRRSIIPRSVCSVVNRVCVPCFN